MFFSLLSFLLTEATTLSTGTTSSPKPITPSPFEPPTQTWKVKDDNDTVCMIMQFGARFVIKYATTSGKVSRDKKCKVFESGIYLSLKCDVYAIFVHMMELVCELLLMSLPARPCKN